MRSPLRYPGGKSKLAPLLANLVPEGMEEYREPMVGGGSLFFYLRERRPDISKWRINDIYRPLIQFYQACQNEEQVAQLMAWAKETKFVSSLDGAGKSMFDKAKMHLRETDDGHSSRELLEKCLSFFYVNRCSFSGSTEAGGFSAQACDKRFTLSAIDRLAGLPDALRNVEITNEDWGHCFSCGINEHKVFLYLDPPYFSVDKLYGPNGALHSFDHIKLRDYVYDSNHRVVISYDDCPEIRELYSEFNICPLDVQYSMSSGGKAEPIKKGKELIITNY